MTYFLGIDPGLQGAIAVYDPTCLNVHNERFAAVWDLPSDPRQLLLTLSSICRAYPAAYCALEQVHSRPRQAGVFKFGVGVGQILGVAASLGLPLVQISPQVWKAKLGLTHCDKNASRALALQLFPSLAAKLCRVKDDGRAEALLLAVYYSSIWKG